MRFIKLIVDTVIHGYALHSIYECGIHFLAAMWSFVTHLLLHFGKPIKMKQGDQNEEEQQPETLNPTDKRATAYTFFIAQTLSLRL